MTLSKIVSRAAMAAASVLALAAMPAAAQVNGIATADPATAIAASQARATAYQQISTTYATQLATVTARRQQAADLGKQLDTNQDGDVSEAELDTARRANNPVLGQIQAIQNEINTLTAPVADAQVYALEQILVRYNEAQQQVVTQKQINMILAPNAFVYRPDNADITGDITKALNTLVPSVSTAVPQGWEPQRQSVQLHQEVQQILLYSAVLQSQRQQQQQQTQQQPQGR